MVILKWLLSHFDARRRRVDMEVLWPAFCENARSIHQARAGFAMHVFNDHAWTRHYSQDELKELISSLEHPDDHNL